MESYLEHYYEYLEYTYIWGLPFYYKGGNSGHYTIFEPFYSSTSDCPIGITLKIVLFSIKMTTFAAPWAESNAGVRSRMVLQFNQNPISNWSFFWFSEMTFPLTANLF